MLEINKLQKKYENFELNCSMKVEKGYITALVGENGAGKSTTFKALLGLIKPDGGEITIFGKKPLELTAKDRAKMGIVLTDSGFSGYLKVKDIIPVMESLYTEFEKSRFLDLCNKLDIPLNKSIKEFSTGMKAKLKVLCALTHKAKFLLLDEPTAGLDVLSRDELLEMLREFMEQDESRSILISSHISTDLEPLCDDFYMIDEGKIIFHEDTDILLSDYALLKVTPQQYTNMDKRYILKYKKEIYGYNCLTNQKQYYLENEPNIAVENNRPLTPIFFTLVDLQYGHFGLHASLAALSASNFLSKSRLTFSSIRRFNSRSHAF